MFKISFRGCFRNPLNGSRADAYKRRTEGGKMSNETDDIYLFFWVGLMLWAGIAIMKLGPGWEAELYGWGARLSVWLFDL
jgi:hypothetical protein